MTQNDKSKNIDIIEIILSNKKLIISITALAFFLTLIFSLFLPNIYKSVVTILPQSTENNTNRISDLAALAGFNIDNSSGANHEAFYVDIIKSDKLLNKLLARKWSLKGEEIMIADFLGYEIDDSHPQPQEKMNNDIKDYLRDNALNFEVSSTNGLMKLSVELPHKPQLSSDIANWLAQELHQFNETYRQVKAIENVNLIQKQLAESKQELEKVENSLKNFQKKNNDFRQSPELFLEYERINREVITENAVYTELRKQFELAKIELIKSKETITILDSASVATEKAKPNRALLVIIATVFSFFLIIVVLVLKEQIQIIFLR